MDPELMDRMLVRIENRIRRAFRSMVREVQDDNSLADIEARISAGELDTILEGVDDAAEKLAIDINTGYVQAGQRTSRFIDDEIDAHATFDVTGEEAVAWMTDQADTLVQAMLQEQQAVARKVLADGRSRGWSDRDIAEDIRASVGLNEQQVDYISSYRDALEAGDYQNAIDRALADDRYDAPLKRAQDNDATLSDDRVDTMVDKYRDNWVDERGDFVAEMEGQSAMNAGVNEAVDQAVEAGDLPKEAVIRTWFTRDDSKVRISHRSMHGQQRYHGEMFHTGYGIPLRYPGDENAPASETAQCRCVTEIEIDLSVMKAFGFFRQAA